MEFTRSQIDLKSISNRFQVWIAFLIITEGLLGVLIIRAENSVERVIYAVLMVAILGAFLWMYGRSDVREVSAPSTPPGFDKPIEPAQTEATPERIASPEPQKKAAPDGSYIINRPPDGWTVRQVTALDYTSGNLDIKDEEAKQALRPQLATIYPPDQEILVFESNQRDTVVPIPGRSTFNQRKVPTALEITIPTRLSILPIHRAQPPFYFDRPLEQSVIQWVNIAGASSNLVMIRNLKSETIGGSQRKQITVELRQDMADVRVNGQEVSELQSNITLIGIRGSAQDYLLILNYAVWEGGDQHKDELELLRSLVNSFEPLKDDDADRKREALKDAAEFGYRQVIAEKGSEIFWEEMRWVGLRLKGLDMDNAANRQRAIDLLCPFEDLAREVGLADGELQEFWEAMHDAEQGDARVFKEELEALIDIAIAYFSVPPGGAAPEAGEADPALPAADEADDSTP